MKDPVGGDFPQSPNIAEALRLPLFSDRLRIHAGIFCLLYTSRCV